MGSRHALIIGVEETDARHYQKKLSFGGARRSAKFFEEHFIEKEKFPTENVTYYHVRSEKRRPTYKNIRGHLTTLKKNFQEGDLLVIYFCGHSLSVKKEYEHFGLLNAANEDEGWVLYDRVIFHFEIWELLKDFPAGSMVVMLADTCYSDAVGLTNIVGHGPSSWKCKLVKRAPVVKNAGGKGNFLRENLDEYNKSLAKSNYSRSYKVKPAVVIIGAGDGKSIVPGANSKGRTRYSMAFQRAIFKEGHKYRPKHLSELFDRMIVAIYRDLARRYLRDKYFFNEANRGKLPIPQWHYHTGKKHTKLRTKTPIFE